MKLFKDYGILGINARNLLYLKPFNSKKAIRMADSKLKTKQFLSARGIPVPKLFFVIRNVDELYKFDLETLPTQFVLKPNMGFGGEGIIPFVGRKNGVFEKSSGQYLSQDEIVEHIGDILEGRFSITGLDDTAFFEQLITVDDVLSAYSYKGLPDIRIVVHNLIPVMAMLRLPTKESQSRANLHQGAIGVGIDISNGKATHIIQNNRIIDEVPGFGTIRGLDIPFWEEILLIASKVQLETNLGYMAVDIAIDRTLGPVLLEINARAGLGVQVANLAPLKRRLDRVQGVKVSSPEKGVRIAQDVFGNKIVKGPLKIIDKQIIGNREKISILSKEGTRIVWASINPLIEKTLIDRSLASDLLKKNNHDQLKLKFSLANKRIQTVAYIEDFTGKSYEVVIGRRDMNGFLIDPNKGRNIELKNLLQDQNKTVKKNILNYAGLDKQIISLDKVLKLLFYLKPKNYSTEREKFLKNEKYNPKFEYNKPKFNSVHLLEKLKLLEETCDDSSICILFKEKIEELRKKINLIDAIGTDSFTRKSEDLYGSPSDHLILLAHQKIKEMPDSFIHAGTPLSNEEIITEMKGTLKKYRLSNWKIKIKKDMVADCTAGKQNALFVRDGAGFTRDRLRMIIAHEIETHILTAENGKFQPYQLFNRGFADYLETQEGLAIWNQEHVLDHDHSKNYRSAMLVLIVKYAYDHSFSETAAYAMNMGMSLAKAFRTVSKIKRGIINTEQHGAFTKESIYFSGYLQIKNFVANGGDLKDIYFGKYNLKDMHLIKSIPNLVQPKFLPEFLIQ